MEEKQILFIEGPFDLKLNLNFNQTDKIIDIKEKIKEKLNFLNFNLNLFFQNQLLNDQDTINTLKIIYNFLIKFNFNPNIPEKIDYFDNENIDNTRKLLFLRNLGYKIERCQYSLNITKENIKESTIIAYSGKILEKYENEYFNNNDILNIESITKLGFNKNKVIKNYIKNNKNTNLTINELLKK